MLQHHKGVSGPLAGRLAGLEGAGDEVLSVYLPAHASGYDGKYYQLELAHLREQAGGGLGAGGRERLKQEAAGLLGHLGAVRPSGCEGLAAFASLGHDVFCWVALPEPAGPKMSWGVPDLGPLQAMEARHPSSLVALVDGEEVRSLGVVLGEVVDLGEMHGVAVKHHRSGDDMRAQNQRRDEERVVANLRAACEVVAWEMAHGGWRRLYLGGPPKARSRFEKMLPGALRAQVAGYVSAPVHAGRRLLLREVRAQLRTA